MRPDEPEPSPTTVEEAARRPRAATAFDPSRPLPPALLERILSAAATAPAPGGLQPWRFLVVRDEDGRRRLRKCARNQPMIVQAPVVVIVLGHHHPDRTDLGPMLAARVAAGECTPERAAEIRGRIASAFRGVPDRAAWATRWAASAAALLTLAAASLDVASALTEGFDDEAVRREFGVPDDHSICCLVALGRAVASEPASGRLGLEELCFDGHFGGPREP